MHHAYTEIDEAGNGIPGSREVTTEPGWRSTTLAAACGTDTDAEALASLRRIGCTEAQLRRLQLLCRANGHLAVQKRDRESGNLGARGIPREKQWRRANGQAEYGRQTLACFLYSITPEGTLDPALSHGWGAGEPANQADLSPRAAALLRPAAAKRAAERRRNQPDSAR